MNCKKCGSPIDDDREYCDKCLEEMNMADEAEKEDIVPDSEIPTAGIMPEEKIIAKADVPERVKENGAKKIIVILACVAVLLIAVIVIVCSMTKNKKNNPVSEGVSNSGEQSSEIITDENGAVIDKELIQSLHEATTTLATNVGSTSPNVIDDTYSGSSSGSGSSSSQTTKPADEKQVKIAEESIKAFLNRKCYFDGAMYTDGTSGAMQICFNGNDYEVLTNLDGIEISIMRLGDKTYFKRPAAKLYCELTDAVMQVIGISKDDFSIDFGNKDYSQAEQIATYGVTINGKDGVCCEYKASNGVSKYYSVDGKLVQINICDTDGTVKTELALNNFSSSIPSDQLNLNGYTSSSIAAMVSDLMQ